MLSNLERRADHPGAMAEFTEHFLTTPDGLRLHYRDYPGPAGRTPVICIPGVQTTLRFFDFIAARIGQTRRVLSIDLRGRGRSDYDPDTRNYSVKREIADVFELYRQAGIKEAVLLGSSRGGYVAMGMGTVPGPVAGLILNDAGPQIEARGFDRVVNILGGTYVFSDWDSAAAALKAEHNHAFPDLPEQKWHDWAHHAFREENGKVVLDFDPRYGLSVHSATSDRPRGVGATMWPIFESIPPMPILVLRGEFSDLLAEATVARMKATNPGVIGVTVKGRGHRPFLDEPESVAAIDSFLEGIE
jgi:pimeloyl-ACP methyl ester carboxylesterase